MTSEALTAPLNQPLYGASFGQAVSRYFKKYATFSGRASRSEFWWVQLFLFLIYLIPAILMAFGAGAAINATGAVVEPSDVAALYQTVFTSGWYILGSLLSGLIWLVTVIPSLALIWRRLHDTNLAGPFFFLSFIPGVGHIILFILVLMPSNPAGARFDQGNVRY